MIGTDGCTLPASDLAFQIGYTNHAPLLDNSVTLTLDTITEDETSNLGNSVAEILASAGTNPITDANSNDAEGIAITSLSSGNGTWQYSLDGGSTWLSVGTVSTSSALSAARHRPYPIRAQRIE